MWRKTRNLIISAGFWFLAGVGRAIGRLVGRKPPGRCVVLYYHAVKPFELDRFTRQMDELLRVARPVSASARGGLENSDLHVAVTFDDAFARTIEIAVPELIKRRIPCAVFVPTGFMGRTPAWMHDGRFQDADETVADAQQLRALPEDLVAIGSHTVAHSNLCALDEETARHELRASRDQLAEALDRPVTLFAFPYGRHTKALVDWAHEAGYERVFTTEPRLAGMVEGERVVGRVRVDPADWMCEFRLKIRGAYCWLSVASSLKSALRSYVPGFGS